MKALDRLRIVFSFHNSFQGFEDLTARPVEGLPIQRPRRRGPLKQFAECILPTLSHLLAYVSLECGWELVSSLLGFQIVTTLYRMEELHPVDLSCDEVGEELQNTTKNAYLDSQRLYWIQKSRFQVYDYVYYKSVGTCCISPHARIHSFKGTRAVAVDNLPGARTPFRFFRCQSMRAKFLNDTVDRLTRSQIFPSKSIVCCEPNKIFRSCDRSLPTDDGWISSSVNGRRPSDAQRTTLRKQ